MHKKKTIFKGCEVFRDMYICGVMKVQNNKNL